MSVTKIILNRNVFTSGKISRNSTKKSWFYITTDLDKSTAERELLRGSNICIYFLCGIR